MGKGEKGKDNLLRKADAKKHCQPFPFSPFSIFPSYTEAVTSNG
jgi:hypothetical protein